MNIDTRKSLLACALILAVTSLRLVEHPFNSTPMLAVMLFSAAIFKDWKWKIAVPFLALAISDVLVGIRYGYDTFSSSYYVYLGFGLVFISAYFILKKLNVLNVVLASLSGSIIFFLVTNFAFFYPEAVVANPTLGNYPHNWVGIVASYQAGLPFFKNMLVGDLMFSGILFGAYALLEKSNGFQRVKA
jgi:hypothetical protein